MSISMANVLGVKWKRPKVRIMYKPEEDLCCRHSYFSYFPDYYISSQLVLRSCWLERELRSTEIRLACNILGLLHENNVVSMLLCRLFGIKCAKCNMGFCSSDLVMRARDNVYHMECFRCSVCSRHLLPGDEFSLREDELLCRADHGLLAERASAGSPLSPGNIHTRQLHISGIAYRFIINL